MPNILIFSLLAFFFVPAPVSAHQPRITESRLTQVPEPEISKAYYGKLSGEPDVYIFDTSTAFDLYVNVLVPDIEGQKKDVSAVVLKNGAELMVLDGSNFEWKKFYEPFGVDTYWMGPEYEARADVGTYEVRVWSSNNDSKYSLAIGKKEAFDSKEVLNAITLVPVIKKNFFNESPIGFIFSPFGWGLIVIMYLFAGIAGLVFRLALKRMANGTVRGAHKNIGKPGRLLRLAIAAGLFLWAITTTWSPILIFFSGFALFEAIFSWCVFYAALGKKHM